MNSGSHKRLCAASSNNRSSRAIESAAESSSQTSYRDYDRHSDQGYQQGILHRAGPRLIIKKFLNPLHGPFPPLAIWFSVWFVPIDEYLILWHRLRENIITLGDKNNP
jgi:hypothetical protein